MSGYKRIKLWNVGRAWRRSPLTLLQSWRKMSDIPLFFKLNGEHYLLCTHQKIRSMINLENQVKIDAGDTEPYPNVIKVTGENLIIKEMDLGTWLPLLQRFLSVTVTPLLERTEVLDLDLVEFIEAPFTWTFAHHLFGVDVRKANTDRAEHLLELISLLEGMLNGSDSRMRRKMPALYQRKIRKLYGMVGPLQSSFTHLPSEVGLDFLCEVIEWRQQVIDTVTWLFVYLQHQPKIENQIFIELNEHLASRAYEPNDLKTLPTLHKLILETLRLAPPHWITRWGHLSSLVSEDVFCQHFSLLPPTTQLVSSPFLDHRESEEWPSPLSFLPHRFLAATHGAQLPRSYIPLGPGSEGHARLSLVLHTVVAISATLLRRGHLEISRSDDDIVQAAYEKRDVFVERKTGVSFGRPQLTVRFHVDERYIHIPSARI